MSKIVIRNERGIFVDELEDAITDAWKRLLYPSLERELRSELTEESGEHGIGMFAENVRNLLMQPPMNCRIVMGIDPAYRTGSKLAVGNEAGALPERESVLQH